MKEVVLKNNDLTAIFLPEQGMNLRSYKKGGIEAIDQNTQAEFEKRFAGLGPLIGPHFYHQKDEWVTSGYDESLFPHIAKIKAKGDKDPFSHGIGRYIHWNYETTKSSIVAHIQGSDTYQGVPLSTFEGVDFKMTFTADLTTEDLQISMSVESERVSLCGLHYYYALSDKKGTITSHVQDKYNDMGTFKPMNPDWCEGDLHNLKFNLENASDYGYFPHSDHIGEVLLETGNHKLKVSYQGQDKQISCQIYSPKDATFVCIEPMSARNPRGLEASSSSFTAQIEVVK